MAALRTGVVSRCGSKFGTFRGRVGEFLSIFMEHLQGHRPRPFSICKFWWQKIITRTVAIKSELPHKAVRSERPSGERGSAGGARGYGKRRE